MAQTPDKALNVDAAKVFLVALLVLAVVVAWVLSKELRRREAPPPAPVVSVAVITNQDDQALAAFALPPTTISNSPANPFTSVQISEYLARLAEERAAAAEARRAAEEARLQAEEAARKEAEAAARRRTDTAPPKPQCHELIYRGSLQRTDGTVVGLIEDQAVGKQKFYAPGATCCGMIVTNIEKRQVSLVLPEGAVDVLIVNKVNVYPWGNERGK